MSAKKKITLQDNKNTFATNELSLENTIFKARKGRVASEDIESK
jgi:hypothetical protein